MDSAKKPLEVCSQTLLLKPLIDFSTARTSLRLLQKDRKEARGDKKKKKKGKKGKDSRSRVSTLDFGFQPVHGLISPKDESDPSQLQHISRRACSHFQSAFGSFGLPQHKHHSTFASGETSSVQASFLDPYFPSKTTACLISHHKAKQGPHISSLSGLDAQEAKLLVLGAPLTTAAAVLTASCRKPAFCSKGCSQIHRQQDRCTGENIRLD